MGMVVRSNIMAMNANRQLGINNSAVTKNLEKLSSGFKINRAGDDASGLAISEKMKAQIKGLETASANSQDGISLVQTAEGALTEVHDMLNRMVELATKSANGTIKDEVDRENVQNEVNALISEIDRIGDATNFNGINLIDGNLSATGAAGAAGVPALKGLALTDTAATAKVTTITPTANTGGLTAGKVVSYTFVDDSGKKTTLDFTVDATEKKLVAKDGSEYTLATAKQSTATEIGNALRGELAKTSLADKFTFGGTATLTITSKELGSSAPSILLMDAPNATAAGNAGVAGVITDGDDAFQTKTFAATDIGKEFSVGGKKFAFADAADVSKFGSNVTVLQVATDGAIIDADVAKMASLIEKQTGYKPTVTAGALTMDFKASTVAGKATGGLTLQIGDTNDTFNKVTVSVDNMKSDGLGVSGLDVSTQKTAGDAVATIKDAINKVSTNRGNLGALQNRLEHTINNLDVTAENMSSANSRIRDTDMAKQMMEYTKMNVLTQAAQAMLAQANQQPQSILQLLQ